ncbi:DUF2963 domain-containing protein [Spirosoma radiotolerans]|uniref:Uncharacterized protein n=1 Tax=Spirosoma radiotolerans TaxID=1379870 RepID=A0A0E3V7S0_9BACT|nr:DUF2963 domain-containing protein [Spirosoma radiotolerans]AKD55686.1 hypothetical protein SD10_13030 [Spirosoma radiotolerans]
MTNRPFLTRQWRIIVTAALLAGVDTSCRPDAQDTTTPQANCRIQTYSTPADRTTYAYDPEGKLLDWEFNLTNGDQTLKSTYTYDQNGYLTASTLVRTDRWYVKSGQPARQMTTTRTYSYSNGRLTGYVSESSPGSSPGNKITGTFDYDPNGQLLSETATFRYTSDPKLSPENNGLIDGSQQTWTYRQNQLVDYTYRPSESGAMTHPYTIVDGRITQINAKPAYEYDSQGRLVKAIVYQQDNLNSYAITEYDQGKAWRETVPAFKGFPTIKSVTGLETNLDVAIGFLGFGAPTVPKSYTYFADYPGHGVVQLTKHTYVNQLNSQGFVTQTTAIGTSTYPDAPPQSDTLKTVFTYTNCN